VYVNVRVYDAARTHQTLCTGSSSNNSIRNCLLQLLPGEEEGVEKANKHRVTRVKQLMVQNVAYFTAPAVVELLSL